MIKVVVVGCGIVGAAIAYELSQVSGLTVTVLEHQRPAQAATGAALGVLMGAISQKTKNNRLRMRLSSIQRYNTWIPELEAVTGRRIPFNQQGILRLCFAGEDLAFWNQLAAIRQTQGWELKLCDRAYLGLNYPQISLEQVIAAVYSPQDRQVDPSSLTLALIEAAAKNGVSFKFETPVVEVDAHGSPDNHVRQCQQIHTMTDSLPMDWLVIAAGLGSTPLTAQLQRSVDIRPVLGQAVHLKLPEPLGKADFQPVITGDDVHLVPLGGGEYWVGATVEFPDRDLQDPGFPASNSAALEAVMQRASDLCPALADATVVRTWAGLRPRPQGRPAPIIEPLPGYCNVLLATGHYRNGVLLAPATAEKIRQLIVGE
jgi:glycine/D-amino acid oxidase-like deaminating enzyme